jgi:RimJ/RimL family protein N-acetyltransferase
MVYKGVGTKKKMRKARAQLNPHRLEMRNLHGKSVALTALKRRDLSTLTQLQQDQAVAQRFGWQNSQPTAEECVMQIQASKQQFALGKPTLLAVRKKPDGKILGVMQMRWGSDQRAEIAWMFLPQHQDSKVFFRARRIAIDWCLARGAKRVWATSYSA